MLIAGPCSYIDSTDKDEIIQTAEALFNVADFFRCKLWLGGTRPERYFEGIGLGGLADIDYIDKNLLPAGVEVQTPGQIESSNHNTSFVWVGARNSQNYALLNSLKFYSGAVMVKRGSGMTTDELYGLFDISHKIYHKDVYIIERGVNGFERKEDCRWSIVLNDLLKIKYDRPDVFERLIVDCSHSAGRKEFVEDIYRMTKTIGIENHMIECTYSGKSRTDSRQMLSVRELKEMIK